MFKTLILTQGRLALELLAAAETIVGRDLDFGTLCLDWGDSFEDASRKAELAIEKLRPFAGLLILADIHGGTPYNVAASLRQSGEIEVVSGVNLPMVVRLGCLTDEKMTVDESADWIRRKGQKSICRAGNRRQSRESEGSPVGCADDRA